ncbi:unnamed protein product [Moneuplotes crassus]|uniref:Uncharacterized protein n=1 Tax=Euplotes crassus TaxID=5936 RepID=A0AAD1XSN4_EUPCR|nr:unnamed protein product [Moneuplotes crassus]
MNLYKLIEGALVSIHYSVPISQRLRPFCSKEALQKARSGILVYECSIFSFF